MKNEINLSSLTLRQKLGQMIIARGSYFNKKLLDLGIGGVFLNRRKNSEDYKNVIEKFKSGSNIKLFFATDMEGSWNPFPWYKSKTFWDIKNKKEAYALGKEHAQILNELGFNLNFSPVSEIRNKVWYWRGRCFSGADREIQEKIVFYIRGLHDSGILATAKHYPGGSMVHNPHKFFVYSAVSKSELENFDAAIKENVDAVMIGQAIVHGILDSKGKQSSISKEIISYLRKRFNRIIISDDISMLGLKLSYLFRKSQIYVDVIKAGNDIVLDSAVLFASSKGVAKGISALKNAVESEEIPEKQINESVIRILKAKGYKVNP